MRDPLIIKRRSERLAESRRRWYLRCSGKPAVGPLPQRWLLRDLQQGVIGCIEEVSEDGKSWRVIASVDPFASLCRQLQENPLPMALDDAALERRDKARRGLFEARMRRLRFGRQSLPAVAVVTLLVLAVVIALLITPPRGREGVAIDCKSGLRPDGRIENCQLASIDAVGMDLTRINGRGANLRSANLATTVLTAADLSYADLTLADLERAELTGGLLVGANLSGARLNGALFAGADLRFANLTGAVIDGALFEGANLDRAIWIDGSRCPVGARSHCIPVN